MTENRRTTFRSKHLEFRDGVLIAAGERHCVRIVDESCGGYCVCADEMPSFPTGVEGKLLDDGHEVRVRIKHYAAEGMHVRIGLERWDPSLDETDLRVAFPMLQAAGIRLQTIALVTLLGLFVGWAFTSEPVRQRLIQYGRQVRLF